MLLAVAFLLYIQTASSAIISGPTLTENNTGWAGNGLSFNALQNSTLTSFVYNNQGLADTILLVDEDGVILESFNMAAGSTQQLINVSWSLFAGNTYGLIVTQEFGDNGRWVSNSGFFPSSNADISINGYANNFTGQLVDTNWWFHFTDITTNGSVSIDAPSTFGILSLGLGLIAYRRNKNR